MDRKSLILLLMFLALVIFSGYSQEEIPIQEEAPADTAATEEDQTATLVDPALGARLFSAECSDCHGVAGDGRGPSADFLKPLPADFTDSTWIHGADIDHVVEVIRDGVKGTAMAGFANVLTDYEIQSIGLYLTQLSEPAEQVQEED